MKVVLSTLMVVGLLSGCAAKEARMPIGECAEVIGAQKILEDKNKPVLMFGHIHGTTESPKFVGDVLCHAVEMGNSVDLYLLINIDNQPFLDAFMASSGEEEDIKRLLLSNFWATDNSGHSSVGIFNLIDIARQYKFDGAEINVWAYTDYNSSDADSEPYDSEREQRMSIEGADFVTRKMRLSSADKHIIISGDVDASKESLKFAGVNYDPVRKFLVEKPVYSFRMMANGGNAWVCWISRSEDTTIRTTECGPRDWPDDTEYLKSDDYPYGFLGNSESTVDYYIEKYDGFYFVGPMSASNPARTMIEKMP
ncbi:MAG: hypothetical protein ABJN69_08430 [Hellea sp.]